MKKQSSIRWWVLAVIVLGAAVLAFVLWRRATPPPATTQTRASSAGSASMPATAVSSHHYPIADSGVAPASSAALPALDQSDAEVAASLLALASNGALDRLLLRDQVIRRVVATVDALPGQTVNSNILPVRTPGGAFLVDQTPQGISLSPANAARYAAYMQVLEQVDAEALVGWYVHHYPLFQQAYRDLGYPHGYFNDRLVAAIDDMLAAPVPDAPVALVRPKVFYRYADPDLEARSAGQKMLMRLGAADESKVKAKLRSLRARLTGAALPPVPAAGSSTTQQ